MKLGISNESIPSGISSIVILTFPFPYFPSIHASTSSIVAFHFIPSFVFPDNVSPTSSLNPLVAHFVKLDSVASNVYAFTSPPTPITSKNVAIKIKENRN